MRDLKRSNALLPAYKQLSQAGMEVFTPMVSRVFSRNGKRIRKEVPFMQDLLFVNDVRQNLDLIVAKTPTLQYRFKEGRKILRTDCDPPRCHDAIYRCDTGIGQSKILRYGRNFRPDVRPQHPMIGGVLDGYEGKLQTIRGSKTKHLIIILPSLLAVSVEINDEYIELL